MISDLLTDDTAWRYQLSVLTRALLIAASLIAAIRLRGEPITHSPKVVSTISDSLKLAHMVQQGD